MCYKCLHVFLFYFIYEGAWDIEGNQKININLYGCKKVKGL